MPFSTYDKDPYKILQVDPKAENEVIAAAYRSLAKRYHPDTNPDPNANERMKDINWAYDILGKPESRAEYDRWKEEIARVATQTSTVKSNHDAPPAPKATETPRQQAPYWSYSPPQPSREEILRKAYFDLLSRNLICQNCGTVVASKPVKFEWNIGMLVMRRHIRIEGVMCRSCIEKYFWEATGKNLFLGWWGYISFFATIWFLLKNLFTYLGALGLEYPQGGVWKQGLGYKMFILGVIGVLVFIFSGSPIPAISFAQSAPAPTVAAAPATYLDPPSSGSNQPNVSVYVNLPPPPPTNAPAGHDNFGSASCRAATSIRLLDVGQTMCVMGTVINSYSQPAGNMTAYYMTFSRNDADFYMVVYDAWYEGVNGSCVKATGKIQQIGNAPVMVVTDKLYKCN